MSGASHAPFRIGMSGTLREVKVPLIPEAFLGPILMVREDRELVEAGRSAEATVLMPYVGSTTPAGGYKDEYEGAMVHAEGRNALLVTLAARAASRRLPVLILVYRRTHGEILQAAIEAAGGQVRWLWGQTPLPEIEAIKRDFEAGRLPVITLRPNRRDHPPATPSQYRLHRGTGDAQRFHQLAPATS